MPSVLQKVEPILKQRGKQDVTFTLGMDGGIDKNNIAQLRDEGVEQVGIASGIFAQKDLIRALCKLYNS
jgi:pentose-5-phosphate-3-epimerase